MSIELVVRREAEIAIVQVFLVRAHIQFAKGSSLFKLARAESVIPNYIFGKATTGTLSSSFFLVYRRHIFACIA